MARQYTSSKNLTSITYWRKFAEHRLVYVLLAFIFGFGIIAYFGMGPMGSVGSKAVEHGAEAAPFVTVNGVDVPRSQYDRVWDRQKQQLSGQGDMAMVGYQGTIVKQLIDMALLTAEAKKRGLSVSDSEVDAQLNKMRSGFDSKPMTDEQFQMIYQASPSEVRDELPTQLLPRKVEDQLAVAAKVPPAATAARLGEQDMIDQRYTEVKLRHILIKTGAGLPDEQAKAKAEKILAEAKSGKDFAALANQYSEDQGNTAPPKMDPKTKKFSKSAGKLGGFYDWKMTSGYVNEFGAAAAKLKPGEISDLVKTQFGYHIIKLEDKRVKLPADYAKEKGKLLADFKSSYDSQAQQQHDQKVGEVVNKWLDENRKSAKVVWHDEALKWRYDYAKANPNPMMGGTFGPDTVKDQQALVAELKTYVPKHKDDGQAALVLGQNLYSQYLATKPGPDRDKLRDEIIVAYAAALNKVEDNGTRMSLAQLYRDAGKPEEALKVYQKAQSIVRWESGPTAKYSHMTLEKAFKDLGHPELAEVETKRLAAITEKEAKDAAEAKKKAEEDKLKKAPGGTLNIPPLGVNPAKQPNVAPKPPAGDKKAAQ